MNKLPKRAAPALALLAAAAWAVDPLPPDIVTPATGRSDRS